MKALVKSVISILVLSVTTIFDSKAQDPAIAGIIHDKDVKVGEIAIIEADFLNGSSTPFAPTTTVFWTINIPPSVEFVSYEFDNNVVQNFVTVSHTAYDAEDGQLITITSRPGVSFPGGNSDGGANLIIISVRGKVEAASLPYSIQAESSPVVGTNNSGNDNVSNRITVAGVLPVTLKNFNAVASGCDVVLNWEVESEKNFSHYELERRTTNGDFVKIAELKGGNNSYIYKDLNVGATKDISYKLKLVDLDGTFTYSNVKTISTNCNNKLIKVYPTPTHSKVTVSGLTLNDKVSLVNSSGQILSTKVAANTLLELDLSRFAAGIYNIVVIDKNGKSNSYKVVKN